MTSVSEVDWKIEPFETSSRLQRHRVGNVAVVGDGEAAAGKIGVQRLDIAQALAAGGRIAHMARRHAARQLGELGLVVEHLRNVADAAPGVELRAVVADDADRFLAAMLQRVQAQRGHRRGIVLGADHAENAALLAQLVAAKIPGAASRKG